MLVFAEEPRVRSMSVRSRLVALTTLAALVALTGCTAPVALGDDDGNEAGAAPMDKDDDGVRRDGGAAAPSDGGARARDGGAGPASDDDGGNGAASDGGGAGSDGGAGGDGGAFVDPGMADDDPHATGTAEDHTADLDLTTTWALLANNDDDDGDGARDGRDDVVNGAADRADLLHAIVRRVHDPRDGARAVLTVAPAHARGLVRVFITDGDGDADVDDDATLLLQTDDASADVSMERLAQGDVHVLVEAWTGRTPSWDGAFELVLTLTAPGAPDSVDRIALRVAPVVFSDNTRAPKAVYVMDIPGGGDANPALVAALQASGVPVRRVDAASFSHDRWLQDNMELGTQSIPIAGAPRVQDTALELVREGGLDAFVADAYLGAGRAFFRPGGEPSSHNYGGNLEIAPPHDGFPQGRLLVGGGAAGTLTGTPNEGHMTAPQRAWLDAQRAQGPALELSSEWLFVGHIDEIFQFIPNRSPSATKGFAVAIASPRVARVALLQVSSSRPLFAGRAGDGQVYERTAGAVLQDEDLMAFNEAAQARIDGVRVTLQAALDLDDADFRELPVLYEPVDGDGLAAAYNPGVQNLVTLGDTLVIPDPEGPGEAADDDVWQTATRDALADLDLELVFVDVFFSYHVLLGEAHCGTNVERAAPAAAWWAP